jgi:hypothetical protein
MVPQMFGSVVAFFQWEEFMVKLRIVLIALLSFCILCLCGCSRHKMPKDFNIVFQFGTTEGDTITLDTYNKVVTKGLDGSMKKVSFTIPENDKKHIYDKLIEYCIQGYDGDYTGTQVKEMPNVKFAIKYTAGGRTGVVTGDGSTITNKKKYDIKQLIHFRDYMLDYVKDLDAYKQLAGQ